MIFRPATFRPRLGRVLAGVTGVLAVLALSALVVAGDLEAALQSVGFVALVVALAFALFWFPKVDVRDDEIEVRNVFSTAHVPWSAIRRIDTKWALQLETDRGTVTAWASPAPSRYATLGMTRGDATVVASSARAAEGSIRPGDAISTESGSVAHVIRTRWEQLRDDDLLDPPNAGTGARREPHLGTIATLLVLAAATVAGFLL